MDVSMYGLPWLVFEEEYISEVMDKGASNSFRLKMNNAIIIFYGGNPVFPPMFKDILMEKN